MTVHDVNYTEDMAMLMMKLSQYCTHSLAHMRLFWRNSEMVTGRKLSQYNVTNCFELTMKVETKARTAWSAECVDHLQADNTFVGDAVESGFAGTRLIGAASVEGMQPTKAEGGTSASTSSAEMKEELSMSTLVPNASTSMNETEEAVGCSGSAEPDDFATGASVLFRSANSPVASSPTGTTAAAATTTAAPSDATITLSASRASLLERPEQSSLPARSLLVHAQSEESKEGATLVAQRDDDHDMKLARQVQDEWDQEVRQTTAQRRAREKEDHEMALKMHQQARQGGRRRVEGEDDGGIGSGESEAEDGEGTDGDYNEADERKERDK